LPNNWIHHYKNVPAHKALSVKQFLAQESITELEPSPRSPDLARNDFWLVPKIKSAFNGLNFQDIQGHPKKCNGGTEDFQKMFPTVGLNA
jgi:hypothetical protein